MNIYFAFIFAVFRLASSVSQHFTPVYKWNICPTITEKSLPTTCSSFVKTFNSSSDLVDKFAEMFLKVMEERFDVEDVFDTSIPVQVATKLVYEIYKQDGYEIGIKDPIPGAELLAEVILELFPKTTPLKRVKFIGRATGQYLVSEGVLTDANVETLADSFSSSMMAALEDSPVTTFHGIRRGVMLDFLLPMGLYTSDKWDTWHSHIIYHAYKITDTLK